MQSPGKALLQSGFFPWAKAQATQVELSVLLSMGFVAQ
jgi:hypothetical protein